MMLFKVATLYKSLITDVTYISFLTSMNSAVELEMFFGTQRLATDITDINICPSVGVHVQHQRFLIGICLATEFTLVQFRVICVCMGFHVVRKRTLVCISFTTHFYICSVLSQALEWGECSSRVPRGYVCIGKLHHTARI